MREEPLLRLERLRYAGSGWWMDRLLPRRPVLLLITAVTLPIAWFVVGATQADDVDAYLATPDVLGQLWFFPLHIVCVRMVGSLWGTGLERALGRLAIEGRAAAWIRVATCGRWASVGAVVAAAAFIGRDVWFGLTPNAETGLIPFDDPELWGFAALGRTVHYMMLGLWAVEWLLFGYLLWLQLWLLVGFSAALASVDFRPHLERVLVGDGYKHMFALLARTATVSLVFALGNLAFIHYTGELVPRESVEIEGVGDALQHMSDMLSTTLLFVLTIATIFVFVTRLRKALTRAVEAELAEASDIALAELAHPLELTGEPHYDVEMLRARVDAQAGLVRGIAFQREVDTLGGRTIVRVLLKAAAPIATALLKLGKMQLKGG